MPEFALPNDERTPAKASEFQAIQHVATAVSLELRDPEVLSTLWKPRQRTATVAVPKTTVYEYYFPAASEDQVGFAWEVRDVQPVPVAHAVRQAAQAHLGSGVLSADPRHDFRATFSRHCVHFGSSCGRLLALVPIPGSAQPRSNGILREIGTREQLYSNVPVPFVMRTSSCC